VSGLDESERRVERPEARSLDALLARLRADEPVAAAAREAAGRKAVAAGGAGERGERPDPAILMTREKEREEATCDTE
jgi:hypothetical protein